MAFVRGLPFGRPLALECMITWCLFSRVKAAVETVKPTYRWIGLSSSSTRKLRARLKRPPKTRRHE
jgi:hypothetical protein